MATSKQTGGYNTDLFVISEIDDSCKCSICHNVFRDPIELACQHIYCKSCIIQILNNDGMCPECKQEVEKTKDGDWMFELPRPSFTKMHFNLRLKCDIEGCDHSCTIENYEDHQSSCQFYVQSLLKKMNDLEQRMEKNVSDLHESRQPPCASRDGTLDENAIANSFRFVNSTRISKRTQYPRRLIPNDENELEFEIEFDFRPAEGVTDGVLFYIHSKAGASSFILVAMHKAVITMAYRRVNNEDTKQYDIDVTERWSVRTYDLVQFFNLKFTYSNSKNVFQLLIDNIDEINAPGDRFPGRFNFKRQFWLGGVSGPQVDDNPLFQDKPGLKTAFVGCIKNFKFLGITWIDQVDSQGRCYSYGDDGFPPPLEANRDVGMLFKGADMDYAKYLNPTSDGDNFSVKFTITTQSDSGMLMHARNVDKTTNVTVFLLDKQVFLEMTSPRGTMQTAMSDVSVCDLKSHTVGVTVTADELTVTLDDHEKATSLLSGLGSDVVQLRSDPIWFGGVGKNSGVNIEPFVGCFRVDSVGTVSKLGGYTSELWDISSTVGRDCPRLNEKE